MNQQTITLYRASAMVDCTMGLVRPGTVAVQNKHIIASGKPDEVDAQIKAHAKTSQRGDANIQNVDLTGHLLLPAMVNAHAHLDLTDLGQVSLEDCCPLSQTQGSRLIDWIDWLMRHKPTAEADITQTVQRGMLLSSQQGVGMLGDIAGSKHALNARLTAGQETFLAGASFLECFGLRDDLAKQACLDARDVLDALSKKHASQLAQSVGSFYLSVEPHAPYSAGEALYQWASTLSAKTQPTGTARSDVADTQPMEVASSHVAETLAELALLDDATGPMVDFLKKLGKWDGSFAALAKTPIAYLAPHLKIGHWLLAHCNYVSDADIELLAQTQTSVAYCPIASIYFGHSGHRYQDMLEAGVNVCLGTDSIVCQPSYEPQPMGILPQMRYLYQRDQTDPMLLLKMATLNGCKAMGLDKQLATLAPGGLANLFAVAYDTKDSLAPLTQILQSDAIGQKADCP